MGVTVSELRRQFLEGAQGAGGDANTLAIHANGLQVNILALFCGAVRVAAGLAKVGTFSRQKADARHTGGDNGRSIKEEAGFGKRWTGDHIPGKIGGYDFAPIALL